MPEPSPESVEALFHQVSDLDPIHRVAFLDERCAGDPELRAAVEELLRFDAMARAGTDVLRGPIAEVRAILRLTEEIVPASIGPYRIVRRLGEGGMGTVYEAECDDPPRTLALKVMRPGLDSPDSRKRFSREARILSRLNHAGIARVHETGTTVDGRLYFVMELVRGLRLDEHARHQVSDFRDLLELMARVCEAVHHAHEQGVVHRDLKPANILIDPTGQPKVLDFGVAQATGAGHLDSTAFTRTDQLIGTLVYMSPEQVAADPLALDARSDVYTLGVILHELLADRLPYGLDNLAVPEIVRVIRDQEPLRLGSVDSRYRGQIETIVAKTLEKDRARRYQSAGDLAADLRRHLARQPIQARPVGRGRRTVKWVRRHPSEAASMAGAGAVVLAALVLVSWSYFRAEAARAEQSRQRQRAEDNERSERRGRYRANIAAASAALQIQNTVAARGVLEDAPGEHRDWEWRYFHSMLDNAAFVLPVPGGKVRWIALSPSGRQLAVCCLEHNQVYLYDMATGELTAVLRGHSAPVKYVAYRPDSGQVATIARDQTVRLWDPATGRQTAVLRTEDSPASVDCDPTVAYNADGSRIVSQAQWLRGPGTSRLWDARTGKEVAVLARAQADDCVAAFSSDGRRVVASSGEYAYLYDAATGRRLAVLGPHRQPVSLLAYSSDGKRIASAGRRDGKRIEPAAHGGPADAIHLWDGEDSKRIAVLPAPPMLVVLFSPDGSRLIAGGDYPDNTAPLWDTATGKLVARLRGHKNAIPKVAFSPDGTRVVTGSTDQTARLWDGRTGQLVAELTGHSGRVLDARFSPDGTRVVTASEDATLRIWDAAKGGLVGVLRGHHDGFWMDDQMIFTADGSRLISGSLDGTVRIWDMSLAERNGVLRGHEGYVYDVAFSPDGNQVATAAWDGTARLWDPTTGRQTGELRHGTTIITSVAYSGDGRRLLTRERSHAVVLWDVATRKVVREWPTQVHYDPRAVLNPAGTMVAAASFEGPVQLWDATTGSEVARLDGHERESTVVAFSPDGRLLASAGHDATVRLWDVAAGTQLAVLRGHTDSVWRVAFSADGKLLASGSSDRTIRLWDVQTHAQLAEIPMGSIIYGMAFSPDGSRLAAGCANTTVRLIDVASRRPIAELRGHSDYVHAVAWSPDGTRLVSGSGDFTARVWDSLTAHERVRRTQARR
ncbi:MAG: protein kinase domain-containing protein [Isosphaeraceae bacterium]